MTEHDDALRQIMRALGRLEEGVQRLREDFTEEKGTAAASRKGVYIKLDEFNTDLTKLDNKIIVSGNITAQVREEVKGVARSLDAFKAEADPPLKDFMRLRNIGYGIGGVFLLCGMSAAAIAAYSIEALKNLLRSWLG
jgi:hypothetical protein